MTKPNLFLTFLFAAFAFPAFGASQLQSISVDTSSLPAGTTGYLDFLFNGGGTAFQSATASLTNFKSNSSLNLASKSTAGTVTGSLPGSLSIANNNAEYLEGITFGSSLSFNLLFSGPAVDNANGGAGSVFTLSLLNSTLDGAYLTNNLNDGYLLSFNINGAGRITPTTYPTGSGAPSVVSIASAIPEPSPALPLTFVLGSLISGAWVLRQRARHCNSSSRGSIVAD